MLMLQLLFRLELLPQARLQEMDLLHLTEMLVMQDLLNSELVSKTTSIKTMITADSQPQLDTAESAQLPAQWARSTTA